MIVILLCGCSQVVYNPETKEIKVNRLFDDNELNGLEIVFPDGGYIVIDQASSKMNPESVKLLNFLLQTGFIKAPPQ